MKNLKIILFVGTLFLIQGCVTNNALQTGRTVGKGKKEILVGATYSEDKRFNYELFTESEDNHFKEIQAHASYRKGITDKFDIQFGGTIIGKGETGALGLNGSGKLKYQFLGNQTSLFAGSVGFGLDIDPVATLGFEFPVYLSIHPNKNLAFYTSPRYKVISSLIYLGSTISGLGIVNGIKVGNVNAFYLEHSMLQYRFGIINNPSTSLHQISLGYSFKF